MVNLWRLYCIIFLTVVIHFPCRLGQEPPGTTEEQVYYAQKLYRSAIHPDTGDLQNVIGRMSFQVPGGMIITVAMLHFYRYFTPVAHS